MPKNSSSPRFWLTVPILLNYRKLYYKTQVRISRHSSINSYRLFHNIYFYFRSKKTNRMLSLCVYNFLLYHINNKVIFTKRSMQDIFHYGIYLFTSLYKYYNRTIVLCKDKKEKLNRRIYLSFAAFSQFSIPTCNPMYLPNLI